MNFCPNCNNILDCIKSLNISSEKISLKKCSDLIKLIENNEDISNYKVEFNKIDILEHKKYLKYDENLKNKINQLFKQTSNLNTSAEYKCLNCGYSKPILETTRLYYNSVDSDNLIFIKSLEENELISNDPLVPHTKDYICKNPNCITHKQSELKDSIFYKDKHSYKVNYICCICFYNW
jgi:hypothetical protein